MDMGSLCEDYNGNMYYYENADISEWQLADDQLLDDDGGWIPYRKPVILAGYLMSKGIMKKEYQSQRNITIRLLSLI